MIPGATITPSVARQTFAGAAPGGAYVTADFLVTAVLAGVDVSASVSPSVTYIGADQTGTKSLYAVSITLPSTTGFLEVWIDPTSGTDTIENGYLSGEIMAYDEDSLAALSLLNQGTPAITSAADATIGDIVDGDSFRSPTYTMPSGKLSPWGITDVTVAGRISVEASIMASPGATAYPITITVVSGVGLTFYLSWTTQQHPALGAGVASMAQFIDVQVIRAAITGSPKVIITTNRYQFTQVWQRETRTA